MTSDLTLKQEGTQITRDYKSKINHLFSTLKNTEDDQYFTVLEQSIQEIVEVELRLMDFHLKGNLINKSKSVKGTTIKSKLLIH
jgi:hypothetical protein